MSPIQKALHGAGAARAYRTPATVNTSTGYDGAELRRNGGIPDSRYAAFNLPSLVNGRREYPTRKV